MAHMVETMAYAGETPWHGLGVAVDHVMSSEEALRLAGLDWDVLQAPVVVNGLEVEGYLANVRSTDGKVLGITSDVYVPVHNREAFKFTDTLVDGKNTKYETAMSLKEGALVVLLARLEGRMILGDEIAQFITFATGHDGKTAITAFDTSTRVVCWNTYQVAIAGAKRVWRFEHMGGVHDRLKAATETLHNARAYMDALENRAEQLYTQKISDEQLQTILTQVFGDEQDFKVEQPMKHRRIIMLKDRLVEVYVGRDDLQNMRGTAWGLYNAFADVAAHATPTFSTEKARERRFLSYINGNKLLESAQKAIEAVA